MARLVASVIAFFAAAFAVLPASAEGRRLDNTELKALMSGGLEYTVDALHTEFRFKFRNDGQWTAVQPGGQEAWGTWRIDGDSLCRVVNGPPDEAFRDLDPWVAFKLRPNCFPVLLDGDRIVTGEFGEEISLFDSTVLARLAPPQAVAVAVSPPPAPPQVRESVAPAPRTDKAEQDLERQRLALEREKMALATAERDRALEAEKRDLERMRIELERERLQREREALQRTRSLPPGAAVAAGDTIPPYIDAPTMLETTVDDLVVSGFARDNVRLTRIELDGKDVAFNARDGSFTVTATVPVGQTQLRIAAFDSDGNKAEHVLTVIRSRDIPRIAFGNFHALVIGIDDYETLPKLQTALTDAREVARTLETNYGYKVRLLENATRSDIIDALDDFRERLDVEDNLLIYYAGHGWRDEQNGRGYWLPAGAQADRRSNWFSNASLTDALQAILAKHVMVVADSCYSGTLTRTAKLTARSPDYISRMAEKRARVVLSSGGLEPVADSGGGKHSVFAKQFLQSLRENEGVLDGTQLFEQVRHTVVLNANQTPEYSDIRLAGHEGGDFLFVRKN